MTLTIRPAAPADAQLIYDFICELAEYEHLSHAVEAKAPDIAAVLFCEQPRAFCDIAELRGEPVGFAFWFYNVSTFTGRHGIYLEDLYVRAQARGAEVGRALVARLAQRCVDEGLGRLEWAVLDWNAPTIAFYDGLGAEALHEWTIRQLTGEALRRLGSRSR